jgi:cytidylate kinase
MPVITIRGQLGSGAPDIGRLIADKLHIDYVDREIIAEVAARLRRDEQDVLKKEMPPSSLLGRIAEALRHTTAFEGGGLPTAFVGVGVPAAFEGVSLPAWQIPLDDTRYLQALESVTRELAESHSLVIRGRGSLFILKDFPEMLHVLIVAPIEVRLKRVMESLNIDETSAKQEIERFDKGVRAFIKKYFNAELGDPKHYDLVINTKYFNFEAAASIIINALSFKDKTVGRQPDNI